LNVLLLKHSDFLTRYVVLVLLIQWILGYVWNLGIQKLQGLPNVSWIYTLQNYSWWTRFRTILNFPAVLEFLLLVTKFLLMFITVI